METIMGAVLNNICRFVAACAVLGILLQAADIVFDLMHAAGMTVPTHLGPLPYNLSAFDLPYMPGVSFVWQGAAALLDDINNFLLMATYVFLIRLMLLYARGEVFSARALWHLNAIAVSYLASVLAGFVELAPATYVLSWPLGAGHRNIDLSFDPAGLFPAAIIFVIARVMDRARSLADENARFV